MISENNYNHKDSNLKDSIIKKDDDLKNILENARFTTNKSSNTSIDMDYNKKFKLKNLDNMLNDLDDSNLLLDTDNDKTKDKSIGIDKYKGWKDVVSNEMRFKSKNRDIVLDSD